jgi:hypothetical protein
MLICAALIFQSALAHRIGARLQSLIRLLPLPRIPGLGRA